MRHLAALIVLVALESIGLLAAAEHTVAMCTLIVLELLLKMLCMGAERLRAHPIDIHGKRFTATIRNIDIE